MPYPLAPVPSHRGGSGLRAADTVDHPMAAELV